ncbi:hypothetical protein B0H13DRAFT_1903758 [Mycena leptocephala]|nr:hypothetical protein B0H13DRAFT_1903758 [Mycena leptocephala]
MALPCLRRSSLVLKLSRSPIAPSLWVFRASMHAEFVPTAHFGARISKSPRSPGVCTPRCVHGRGCRNVSGATFWKVDVRGMQCRPVLAPALASYPSRPRLDPSFSLAVRERDTTLYDASDDTHSRAHLVPIDIDVKGRESDGGGVRVDEISMEEMEMEMERR